MRILVTGASGFVGSRLVERLSADSAYDVRAAYRLPGRHGGGARHETFQHGELANDVDWRAAVNRVNAVVHLAARVHVMKERVSDPLSEFRQVNVVASVRLAEQAAQAGVERFVYVSSVKVNGESTSPQQPFRVDDTPHPQDPYAVSKYEAERALTEVSRRTGMEVVVVRPPLVYGPRVRANFRTMMTWLCRGLPLPIGSIPNRRSLVGLDNLCDLLVICSKHPVAAGKVFFASDSEDVSTTELLRRLGRALGHPARLIPVPNGLVRLAFRLAGKEDLRRRFFDSLCVDNEPARRLLGWRPAMSLDEGLRQTADAFWAELEDARS